MTDDKNEIFQIFENIDNIKKEDIQKIIQKYDTDKNGYLDVDEYFKLTPLFLERIKVLHKSEKLEDKIQKKFYLHISAFTKVGNFDFNL
jgi:hypothetical protein